MKNLRLSIVLAILLLICGFQPSSRSTAQEITSPLAGDALQAPPRPRTLAANGLLDPSPSRYQPSAFLAGRVAVQVLFVESDGSLEPSTNDWTSAQVAEISRQISAALDWWGSQLPNARLSFDLVSQVVPSRYEPIEHGLSTESQWIGDTLSRMGIKASNYFDQAYDAADNLRRARHTDWATTIFVANSSSTTDGRFADGHFAYAYINGPFMVITSDAGPYTTAKLAPVVAHELGHIFGALDQYASASTPCTQESGYLSIPATNSQANNCGTHYASIMLEPLTAYTDNQIDESALGQIGYRDRDNDTLPDPLDTAPIIQLQINQPTSGRPTVTGQAIDQPFPSPTGESITINSIKRIEYRANGGEWTPLPPQDGAYGGVSEAINSTLPLYDGAHTIELRAVNSVGASSAPAQHSVSVSGIGTEPHYQVSIAKIVNSDTTNVNLVAPSGSAVQISEDPFFGNAPWMPAQATMPWQLSGQDGARTIYVRFRDTNGLESRSFANPLTVDRTPPSGRALLHSTPNSWIEIQAADQTTSVAAMQISFDNGTSGSWQNFQPTLPLTLQASTVTIRLRDQAGNISEPIVAQPVTSLWLPLVRS